MAIIHHIREHYAEIIITGRFSSEELFSGFEKILSGSKAQKEKEETDMIPVKNTGTHLMINVTKSEEMPPLGTVERIAGIIANSGGGFSGRVAVLVDEKARYGRARQLGAFLAGYGISSEPFYDRDEATRWLKK